MISIFKDIDRIGYHCENISENAEQLVKEDVDFPKESKEELKYISELVLNAVENAIICVEQRNRELIIKARFIEQ